MSTVKMMVEPGDTLWRIAGRLNADGEQQVDVVNDIRSLNPGLSSSGAIIAGQAIIVPVNRGTVNPDLHLAKVDTGVEHSM
jgi:LysM repeat protein